MEILLNAHACTLPTTERPLRLAEFDRLFATQVQRVDRDARGHVRLHFAGEPGVRDMVRDLTERESSCCSFFTFTLSEAEHDLTLDITVPTARQDILDALAVRAEELSS
jgi:hypothetical protein